MSDFDEKNWSKYLEDDPVEEKLGDNPVAEAMEEDVVELPTKEDIEKEDITNVLIMVIEAMDKEYGRKLKKGYDYVLKMIPELMAG